MMPADVAVTGPRGVLTLDSLLCKSGIRNPVNPPRRPCTIRIRIHFGFESTRSFESESDPNPTLPGFGCGSTPIREAPRGLCKREGGKSEGACEEVEDDRDDRRGEPEAERPRLKRRAGDLTPLGCAPSSRGALAV